MWGLIASFCCIFAPLWESRSHIAKIVSHVMSCSPAESSGEALTDTKKAVFGAGADDVKAAAAADK